MPSASWSGTIYLWLFSDPCPFLRSDGAIGTSFIISKFIKLGFALKYEVDLFYSLASSLIKEKFNFFTGFSSARLVPLKLFRLKDYCFCFTLIRLTLQFSSLWCLNSLIIWSRFELMEPPRHVFWWCSSPICPQGNSSATWRLF